MSPNSTSPGPVSALGADSKTNAILLNSNRFIVYYLLNQVPLKAKLAD